MDEVVFIGYHGTVNKDVDSVLDDIINRGFEISIKDIEWLGKGIYFFDNESDAHWWNNNSEKKKFLQKGIIKAEIFSKKMNFLNLDNEEDRNKLKEEFPKYLSTLSEYGPTFDKENIQKLQCILLDMYKEEFDIQLLKKTFSSDDKSPLKLDGEKLLFSILSKSQVQYCAANNNNIRNKEVCYSSNFKEGLK